MIFKKEKDCKIDNQADQGFSMRGKIEEWCSILRESQRPFRHFASLKAIHGLFFHALFMPLIYFACFVSAESLSSLKKVCIFEFLYSESIQKYTRTL